MRYFNIDPVKLINRLSLNLPLSVFEHLEVMGKEGDSRRAVRVTPEWYRNHRMDAKATINRIREAARQEGLEANYNPRGTWLIIGPKLGR
jgi:hypothetical protein